MLTFMNNKQIKKGIGIGFFWREGNQQPLKFPFADAALTQISLIGYENRQFGFRQTPDFTERGMYYESISTENDEPVLISSPHLRYIEINPGSLNTFFYGPRPISVFNGVIFRCGHLNFIEYNDKNMPILQYSVMNEWDSGVGEDSFPWSFSQYHRQSCKWEFFIHKVQSHVNTWTLSETVANESDDLLHKNGLNERQTLISDSSQRLSFCQGNYTNAYLEGEGYDVSVTQDESSYFFGEFKHAKRNGPGRELIHNRRIGKTYLLKGSWVDGQREGLFVIEHSNRESGFYLTDRGVFKQNQKVGLWVSDFGKGLIHYSQNQFQLVCWEDLGLFESTVFWEDTWVKRRLDVFLILLSEHQAQALFKKTIEMLPSEMLIQLCIKQSEHAKQKVAIECLAHQITPLNHWPIEQIMLLDNQKLLLVFRQTLIALEGLTDTALYAAVKGLLDLFDSRINQKLIKDRLAPLFPDVPYVEVGYKKEQGSVTAYQQQIKQRYFIAILERAALISHCLSISPSPHAELQQAIDDIKREDVRITALEREAETRREAERRDAIRGALWRKTCVELDESVLAFMRSLRSEQSVAREELMNGFKKEKEVILKNNEEKPVPFRAKAAERIPASFPETLRVKPTLDAVVSVAKAVTTPASQKKSVSIERPKNHTQVLVAKSECVKPKTVIQPPPVIGTNVTTRQASALNVATLNRKTFVETVAAASSTTQTKRGGSVTKAPVRSQVAQVISRPSPRSISGTGGCFFSSNKGADVALVRPEVDHQLIARLPIEARSVIPPAFGHAVEDLLCIYRGMIILELQRKNLPITVKEVAFLQHAKVNRAHYFNGLGNALKYSDVYFALEKLAMRHVMPLVYIADGKTITMNLVMAYINQKYLSPLDIPAIQQLRAPQDPSLLLFTDNETIYMIIFGLINLIADDLNLSSIVDRSVFTGDYRAFLNRIDNRIIHSAPLHHERHLRELKQEALACFWHVVNPRNQCKPTLDTERDTSPGNKSVAMTTSVAY